MTSTEQSRGEGAAAPAGLRRPSLEVHVAISPNALFLNRAHYLAASLREYGGAYATAPLIVTVGADQGPVPTPELAPWTQLYDHVEFRWLDRSLHRRFSYWGTRHQRCCHPMDSEMALMLDPDVLCVGPIDELVEESYRAEALMGTTAHVSPVRGHFTWNELYRRAGLGPPLMQCEHSGWGLNNSTRRYCPPYFNLGVLMAPSTTWRRIASTLFAELESLWDFEDFFRAQSSLTLAVERHSVRWQLMSMKFNYPNDVAFPRRYADEFDDLRLVHYLRKDQFDKDRDWETPEQVERQIERVDLHAVNRVFLDRVRPVHARVLRDLDEVGAPIGLPEVE